MNICSVVRVKNLNRFITFQKCDGPIISKNIKYKPKLCTPFCWRPQVEVGLGFAIGFLGFARFGSGFACFFCGFGWWVVEHTGVAPVPRDGSFLAGVNSGEPENLTTAAGAKQHFGKHPIRLKWKEARVLFYTIERRNWGVARGTGRQSDHLRVLGPGLGERLGVTVVGDDDLFEVVEVGGSPQNPDELLDHCLGIICLVFV